jgi:tetratricopeptide (TPR) repeat protein
LLYRLADALYVAADDSALEALEAARDALLAAGDRQTAAEAELSLSRVWWHRGQRATSVTHQERAAELAGNEPSPATARVLATVARARSIGGEPSQGLRIGEQALAMADALGIDELRAHSLTTIATSKDYLGEPGAMADIEQALEIAIAARSPQVGTILNNMAVQAFFSLDLRKTSELFDEGQRASERLGDASGARWLRAQQANMAFWLGRWDEALELVDAFIAECEAGSSHYLESLMREDRASIREARGDIEGALADFRVGLAQAREAGDPQELLPRLSLAILVFEQHGLDEARDLAPEAVELARANPHEAALSLSFGFLLSRAASGFGQELRPAIEDFRHPEWKELALACLDRDFVRGADIWADAGSPTWEARVRLRAAEELIESGRPAEGEEQARKALAFYRSVAAVYYIERCEALLQEAQSA